MNFREFDYSCLDDLKKDAESLGLNLHFSDNFKLFQRETTVEGHTIPNILAFHPMEGTDGRTDGSPDELTIRRYERFSKGGAGLLWFEAVAVVPEGRASPRQLWIHEKNLAEYQRLFDSMMRHAQGKFGDGFVPLSIMQLTHSGRFSRPEGKPAPVIAAHNPYLDPRLGIDESYPVIGDDELERLEDQFVEAAVLAKKAGFHGVDVKACHRYLNSELLSAFTREGRYGGTYEGRTRFLLNVGDKIKSRLGSGFIVATRINIYDGIPYPHGWGMDREDFTKYDLSEPIRLLKELHGRGVGMANLTMGTPYYNPHVNRPYDKGGYTPPEHPLEGVARLTSGIGEVQKAVPGMAIVGTGYSWLREFSPYLAAGTLQRGLASFIGYGREAFAYPDFARDLLEGGRLKKEKCCITCGKCTEIMRGGGTAGCVIRDAKVYAPIYREYCGK